MSSNLNFVNQLFTTNVEAANTGTTLATVTDGDILIVDDAGTVLTGTPTVTSAANNKTIRIVYGTTNSAGTTIGKKSGAIELSKGALQTVNVASYSAPTNQVRVAGFNGTTGALPTPSNSTEYLLKVNINDDQRYVGNRQTNQTYHFVTDASATAIELAFGMVDQIQDDVRTGNTNSYVTAEVLTNGTFTAFTMNAVVNQFSDIVTATAHIAVAGDYVRIGGTADTVAVYKVAEVLTANTFRLTGKYMAAGGTILAANIGIMTAITAVGIKISGRTITSTPFKYEFYQTVNFEVGFGLAEDLGRSELAPFTQTVAGFKGVGNWQTIRDMFYKNMSLEGKSFKMDGLDDSGFNPTSIAVAGKTYNVVTITYLATSFEAKQLQSSFPRSLTIAFHSATAPTASTKQTNFLQTLESLAESVRVFVQ